MEKGASSREVTLRIALVDDEPDIRSNVAIALEREGLLVDQYADGDAASVAFAHALPDLAILDIMLPGVDGLELCRRLRARSRTLPILFLTSRDEEFDRVLGLELGADDYLCKPFSLRELTARVRVLIRRLRLLKEQAIGQSAAAGIASATETVRQGPLMLDLDRHHAAWDETPLALTITEFRLLLTMARRPGHVRSRAALIEAAYPEDRFKSERTIDTHIKRLRAKLGALSTEAANAIETVYGVGYRFSEALVENQVERLDQSHDELSR